MNNPAPESKAPCKRVVIVGGGFAGLNVARSLSKKQQVEVLVVDKKNHHTFQPLLYQVATTVISPNQIAVPLRHIFKHSPNIKVIMDEATGFNLATRSLQLKNKRELHYDYLVVAAGARHSYFGNEQWSEHAPGLKTIEDATAIRRKILMAFEKAEIEAYHTGQHKPIHFAIIGGGPTGVELAGSIIDIATKAIAKDFDYIDPRLAKVTIYEGSKNILGMFPESLSLKAEKQLQELGVTIRKNCLVTGIENGRLKVKDEWIDHSAILWTTGAKVSPLAGMLEVPTDKSGKVIVNPDLSIPGYANVFVIGDMALARKANGNAVPSLASAAIQEGKFAAKCIMNDIQGQARGIFNYKDYGSMATIGRNRAIAKIGNLQFSGIFAWFLWAFVHILMLIGFRNRLLVFMEWVWSYFSSRRSSRLITSSEIQDMEIEENTEPNQLNLIT